VTALAPFVFEGLDVRVTDRDGAPWFVAADVCEVLGIGNSRMAVTKLDEDEKDAVSLTDTMGREQRATVISESGLYTLILRNRSATIPGSVAHRFRKWVTAEVLPAIRRTGGYGRTADPMVALNDPATLRQLLAGYSERVEALQVENAALTPKAEALDRLATAEGSLCITDAAKALQLPPRQLFGWLQERRWIFRRHGTGWLGYSDKTAAGLVEHKVTTIDRPDGTQRVSEQVRITPKGLARIAAALGLKDAA
jgi:anti-repressor protein